MLTLVDYHKMNNSIHNRFVYKLCLESMNTMLQVQTYQNLLSGCYSFNIF